MGLLGLGLGFGNGILLYIVAALILCRIVTPFIGMSTSHE